VGKRLHRREYPLACCLTHAKATTNDPPESLAGKPSLNAAEDCPHDGYCEDCTGKRLQGDG